jgi:hypothetical protein
MMWWRRVPGWGRRRVRGLGRVFFPAGGVVIAMSMAVMVVGLAGRGPLLGVG